MFLLDLLGTLVFAISGAFRAVKHELDLLGVLVLAVATGVGGGLLRDLLLGVTPPAALSDERYLLMGFLGGLVVFLAAPRIATRWDCVMVADAVGLGVFAATGASRAADAGLGTLGVILMAGLTATGGGVIRDVLVCEIPAVLRAEVYATAALAGGAVFVAGQAVGFPMRAVTALAMLTTIGGRLLAMQYHLSLPRVKSLPASPSELTRWRKQRKRCAPMQEAAPEKGSPTDVDETL